MADWKKIALSGSQVDLNIITASGDISASGKWYANLDEADNQDVVAVYDQTTGQFKKRDLNSFPGIG